MKSAAGFDRCLYCLEVKKEHMILGRLLREELQNSGRYVDLPDGTTVAERIKDTTNMSTVLQEVRWSGKGLAYCTKIKNNIHNNT